MARSSLPVLVTLIGVMGTSAVYPLSAGQRLQPPKSAARRPTATVGSSKATSGIVAGGVLKADRTPFPFAHMQLRNMDSGAVVGMTAANHLGEFEFTLVDRGQYVVEVSDENNNPLGVGEPVTVVPGETVATLIVLAHRVPSLAGLFRNTAGAIISTAAGAGITAVTSTGQRLSPEQ